MAERTPEEQAGMRWWNSITRSERAYWLERADSARPVDAWREYLRQTGTDEQP